MRSLSDAMSIEIPDELYPEPEVYYALAHLHLFAGAKAPSSKFAAIKSLKAARSQIRAAKADPCMWVWVQLKGIAKRGGFRAFSNSLLGKAAGERFVQYHTPRDYASFITVMPIYTTLEYAVNAVAQKARKGAKPEIPNLPTHWAWAKPWWDETVRSRAAATIATENGINLATLPFDISLTELSGKCKAKQVKRVELPPHLGRVWTANG